MTLLLTHCYVLKNLKTSSIQVCYGNWQKNSVLMLSAVDKFLFQPILPIS